VRLSGSMRLAPGLALGLALTLTAACGSSPPPVAPPVPKPAPAPALVRACDETAAKMTSPPGRGPDELVGFEDRYRAALAVSCVEDAWPAEVHRCVAAAIDADETTRCEELLDDERRARASERLAPVWDEVYREDSEAS
jgi:hypothetical protein